MTVCRRAGGIQRLTCVRCITSPSQIYFLNLGRQLCGAPPCSNPQPLNVKQNTPGGIRRRCFLLAERVGFYPRTQKQSPGLFLPRLRAGRAVLISTRLSRKTKVHQPFGWCTSVLAERVGFEPTDGFTRQTISSRSRYDHFDTTPY